MPSPQHEVSAIHCILLKDAQVELLQGSHYLVWLLAKNPTPQFEGIEMQIVWSLFDQVEVLHI